MRDPTKMDAGLAIQIGSEEDLDALVRLAVAFRDHLRRSSPSAAQLGESIALLLKDAGTEFFLALDTKGVALGYAQSRYRYSSWTASLDAELEDLFVVAEARRRGIGRQLVEFAIGRAAERGCRRLGLNTNERNEPAVRLYRQLGFVAERALWSEGRQLWLEKSLD